jgi:hypothetical protein
MTYTAHYMRYGAACTHRATTMSGALYYLLTGEDDGTLSACEIIGPDGEIAMTAEAVRNAYVQGTWPDVTLIDVASPDSLDAAWAEAEAALPEGWAIDGVMRGDPGPWVASSTASVISAHIADDWRWAESHHDGYGPTPAAALRDLAAKLREVGRCSSMKPGTDLRCMRDQGHHEPHQNTTIPAVESEW